MKLVMISPERDDPREIAVLGALFAAGLERYHVRKPRWLAAQLETWLRALPTEWRTRLVLHQHHELVATLGLGGRHWRDEKGGAACPQDALSLSAVASAKADALSLLRQGFEGQGSTRSTFTSRSCHDLATLRATLGQYDSMFFGPVFPSISKPGHGLSDNFSTSGLSSLLSSRTPNERRTTVLALGGVTAERLPQVRALGFDGVAVLGAVWQADDPVAAFCELKSTLLASEVEAHGSQRADHDTSGGLTSTLDVECSMLDVQGPVSGPPSSHAA
jgi:thiamine-phosphate pyrophosphorylase